MGIWETKLTSETLKDYIFKQTLLPTPKISKIYKNTFNKGQIEQIDSNATCERFDICLYVASYSLTAQFNATLNSHPDKDNLKVKLKEVKDIRNNLLHELLIVSEAEIDNYVTAIELLMNEILNLIGNIFGCRDDTDLQKVVLQANMKKIMKISR